MKLGTGKDVPKDGGVGGLTKPGGGGLLGTVPFVTTTLNFIPKKQKVPRPPLFEEK